MSFYFNWEIEFFTIEFLSLMPMQQVKIIECPRDAMQGIKDWIPTDQKVVYLQALLNCGFHTLDFGSFVSPKAIPQMKDTAEVLSKLDLSSTKTKLLAIVANVRGAEEARSEEHTSELQSRENLVCRLLLEKKKNRR